MFSQVCVKNSVCRGKGMHSRGSMQVGGVWQGVCMVGGMHDGGGYMGGGVHGTGARMAGETATVADGTHPTGMYSCSKCGKVLRHLCQKVHRCM